MVWSVECLRHWSKAIWTKIRTKQYWKSACYLNCINGPVEEVFSYTWELIFIHDGVPCHKGRSVTQFLILSMELKHFHGRGVAYLEAKNKKENHRIIIIANKRNLIGEFISVWARNDKIRNVRVELVHSMAALLWHLTRSKAHLPNAVLGLVFCHHVSIK